MGDLGLALMKLAKFQEDSAAGIGQYTDVGASVRQAAGNNRKVGMVRRRRCVYRPRASSLQRQCFSSWCDKAARRARVPLPPSAPHPTRGDRHAALPTLLRRRRCGRAGCLAWPPAR